MNNSNNNTFASTRFIPVSLPVQHAKSDNAQTRVKVAYLHNLANKLTMEETLSVDERIQLLNAVYGLITDIMSGRVA